MGTLVDNIHNVSSQALGALTGDDPSINTLAIISAENPHGNPLSPDMTCWIDIGAQHPKRTP